MGELKKKKKSPQVSAQLAKCRNCSAERHDQGSNPGTSTYMCVCEFIMVLSFRLPKKKKERVCI